MLNNNPDFMMTIMAVVAICCLAFGLLLAYVLNARKRRQAGEHIAVLESRLEKALEDNNHLSGDLQAVTQQAQALKVVQAEQEVKVQMLVAEADKQQQDRCQLETTSRQLNSELMQSKQSLSTVCAQYEAEQAKNRTLTQARDSVQTKYDQLQLNHHQLTTQYTELKTALDERDASHKEKLAQFDNNKQVLTREFENLANKIFEEKGKTFTDTSKSSIDTLLKPFREQIEGFQKRVNDIHDAATQGNANLSAEIKKVRDVGLKMSSEATNLSSALKGDSQQRGAWGEAQLQRTLEMSGLVVDVHYQKQSAFKDAEGKNKQTDFLIKLPGDKHIIIDSKVTLVAYDKAVGADTDEAYALAMEAHVLAVKSHIDSLVSKDYTNLIGVRSPNFVLMFMPIEPAYIEALKHQKDLFTYGYDRNIVLVSHTTLMPILRTVANLWVMEQSNVEAREISDKAGELYNTVCTLAERLTKLGNTMNTASRQYNDTVTALVGQQGLYGKVERFTQLSSKVSKSLPKLEPKHMDFETQRLALVVEPISEALTAQASEPPLAGAPADEADALSTVIDDVQ